MNRTCDCAHFCETSSRVSTKNNMPCSLAVCLFPCMKRSFPSRRVRLTIICAIGLMVMLIWKGRGLCHTILQDRPQRIEQPHAVKKTLSICISSRSSHRHRHHDSSVQSSSSLLSRQQSYTFQHDHRLNLHPGNQPSSSAPLQLSSWIIVATVEPTSRTRT